MSQEHEPIDDQFTPKKPSFLERCKHSFGSFFKDGVKGALVGLAVGAVVGATLAFAGPALGLAYAGSALAFATKVATASMLFGGALHATMGAIEAFAKAGNELDVEKDKDTPAKQQQVEKAPTIAKQQETEQSTGVAQEPSSRFRDMIAARRTQSQQMEQRY